MPLFRSKATRTSVAGNVEPGYEEVRQAFRDNFINGWEEGAAFAAYKDGRCVVDLWGGWQDRLRGLLWREDTTNMMWSSTKGVTAVCLALLADRKYLDYEMPVCHYWPEFAQNGKEKITVKQLLSHQAGLPLVRSVPKVDIEFASDSKRIGEVLAAEEPLWEPGSRHGYHALTMGWYMDHLLRRVDPDGRSTGVFFKEEIAEPFGIDFRIGTPKEEQGRIARQEEKKMQGLWRMITRKTGTFFSLLSLMLNWNSLMAKTGVNTEGMSGPKLANDPVFRSIELPHVNGTGTARSLAKLFGILANGGHDKESGKRLLSQNTCRVLNQPVSIGKDQLYQLDNLFSMFSVGMEVRAEGLSTVFGHPGYGGQVVFADPDKRLAWCYTTSRLSIYGGAGDDPRSASLKDSLYAAVEKLRV